MSKSLGPLLGEKFVQSQSSVNLECRAKPERRRRDCRRQRDLGQPKNQLRRASRGSQKMKEQLQTLYESDLGPLYI